MIGYRDAHRVMNVEEELRETIGAQAERIRVLESQLQAKNAALDAATDECTRLHSELRKRAAPELSRPALIPAPVLSWRERVRKNIILFGGRLLPRSAKTRIKRFWDPWALPRQIANVAAPASNVATPVPQHFDVICFSIIDWDFRWQRPQQLMSRFADAGHRVFVFKTTEFLRPGDRKFQLAQLRDNVWEITLAPPVVIDVYAGAIAPETTRWFSEALDELRRTLGIVCAVSIVQVATWHEVAVEARRRFGWRVVYDCMDEWDSFPGMKPELLAAEERLVSEADLLTVSARRLFEKWKGHHSRVELVRNATDFDHFAAPVSERFLERVKRPIIGYFGAIAAWFDVELLASVAAQRPGYSFVLIGGVFDVDVTSLEKLPNVHLAGQQPYSRMPAYLHEFDVCTIPFVLNEITAATDPIKFYEYVSLGKPVVSTHMPELEPYRDALYLADDADDFLEKLDAAVVEDDPALNRKRVELALANTWPARTTAMLGMIRNAHPKVSVVIVSYNGVELTRACIESVLTNSIHPNLEVLVVDNASSDGSAEVLSRLTDPRVRIILNDENRGFAAANNQGLQLASGEYLVLLNNDTVVPRGWLPRMLRHLEDPEIGLTVAVTNFSGNESRISVPYTTIEEMYRFAERYMASHEGERFDIHVAAMYCVGMRRDVYERLGPLDEEYGTGMFEDDDYSHRTRLAGLRVVCMEDVFVHHIGQASFSRLTSEEYQTLWARNQAHFERKWGVTWQPHRAR